MLNRDMRDVCHAPAAVRSPGPAARRRARLRAARPRPSPSCDRPHAHAQTSRDVLIRHMDDSGIKRTNRQTPSSKGAYFSTIPEMALGNLKKAKHPGISLGELRVKEKAQRGNALSAVSGGAFAVLGDRQAGQLGT